MYWLIQLTIQYNKQHTINNTIMMMINNTGGPTGREETCIAYTMYYPRQKDLTTCHSSPSLPTVLHSLGIDELDKWVPLLNTFG